MDIRTLKLFAEYNRKTNSDMNVIIQKLQASQWNQKFMGYYDSYQIPLQPYLHFRFQLA